MESNRFVDILKKNHDVMLEKYENYKNRNEYLEKTAQEKEQLYGEVKSQHDQLAHSHHTLQRKHEDNVNALKLLENKLKVAGENLKTVEEERKALKIKYDNTDQ